MNIIALFAHPDDETMLAGGTLALLAQNGASVHYLCATRGEGGEIGEPPLCTQEQLGEVREKEMACAVQALGGRSLTFLDYVDPRVGADNTLFAYSDNLTELVEQVAAQIRQFDAQIVISHGSNGEYGHPAHLLTHQAAHMAIESLDGGGPGFYTTAAIFPEHPRPRLANPDDPADLILDVTPALDQKTQAALCHRTQHALFVRRASEEAGHSLSVPEVIMKVESLRQWQAPGHQRGQDSLTTLLTPYLKN
jgi:LmbE family N-acetylglucosaminyl deacetylase